MHGPRMVDRARNQFLQIEQVPTKLLLQMEQVLMLQMEQQHHELSPQLLLLLQMKQQHDLPQIASYILPLLQLYKY